ncbi:MAG TPA: Ig-like domain-containing protein [Bryobacteraceae bacterium]|nr:Ig-like domain-containing protein [Bryobacteraceae bacterium]
MIRFLLLLSISGSPVFSAGVKVLFDPANPETGPFPTDYLTVPAANTKTARRIQMPIPSDCNAQPNACEEAALLSEFDGFHLHPRVRIRFSGAIHPDSLKDGIYLVARENLAGEESGIHKPGDIVPLNRIVYDPVTHTAYGKPDDAMDQHRRYLLVVTESVKDAAGDPVEADSAFTSCGISPEYCQQLSDSLHAASIKAVAASLFTTMSATAWLEKARDQLALIPASRTPASGRNLFPVDGIASVTLRLHSGVNPDSFADVPLPIELLQLSIRAVSIGSYTSPSHLGPGRTIAATPSAADLALPAGTGQIHYLAYLPRRAQPDQGYPVIIYQHGLGDNRLGGTAVMSIIAADQGLATIAISAPGHGFGPQTMLQVRDRTGSEFDIPLPGRGVDLNGDGRIEGAEGCAAVASSPLGLRDCLRQTTVDLLQLVRLIRAGLDADGDGVADFDRDRIYFAGQSLGAMAGTMLMAVEPGIQFAALNSGGGPVVDIARWSPAFRGATAQNLALRQPSLLNAGETFAESYVLRDRPAKVVATAGAIDIQNALEIQEWLQAEGDPASYAVHLKRSPLNGGQEKSILWQYALGDATVPNPAASALVRYADMKSSTWIYRHHLARALSPNLDADPHGYLISVNGSALLIANAAIAQMASFFSTGMMADPNGGFIAQLFRVNLFEQPSELPEELNFPEP